MRGAALLIAAVLVAGCSGGDDSSDDVAPQTDPATTVARETTPTTAPTSSDVDDGAPETSAAPDEAEDEAEDDDGDEATDPDDEVSPPTTAPLIDGIEPSIDLLTPSQAGEIRPMLEWSPVDGATHYLATVYAPDGSPYWTWTGPATSIHVGGEPKLSDDVPGPSVVAGMTWGVVALDDALVPIASSARQPIEP